MKQTLLCVLFLVLACTVVGAATASKTMPLTECKIIRGDEPLPAGQPIPYTPGTITDSPGIIVGYTYYDYQTNGSSGNRIALADDGSVYFSWMNLLSWPYPPGARHIYYNWVDADGNWAEPEQGGQVSVNSGSGYTNLDLIYGNRGAIAYHVFVDEPDMIVSVDGDPPGLGIFDHYHAPWEVFPQTPDSPGQLFWPYIAVDRSDRIHLGMTESTDIRLQRMGYTRSNDGGLTWTNIQLIDTVMVISCVLDASPVSDRVVYAYSKCIDTTTQWNNNIVYYVSENGTSWDWRYGRHNITNYGNNNDSLWAYTDLDVIFDYNDYIHIIWNAQWVTDAGVYYRTFLFHYNEETDEINTITAKPDSLWMDMSGVWNRPICKMNLGVQEDGNVIFATWTEFDTSDVSAGGFGNGDIFMSYTDDGTHWYPPTNITNSQTPGCYPGECDSDHWSTLADRVTDLTLHVFYTEDKDAGGIPQTEGAATENPMRYLEYPITVDIDEGTRNLPENFSLNQNYPNPFNARTTISFDLKKPSPVSLDIFDITGARLTTLVNADMPAGSHNIVWDASNVASGVYYYKLVAGDQTQTRQAVLIK